MFFCWNNPEFIVNDLFVKIVFKKIHVPSLSLIQITTPPPFQRHHFTSLMTWHEGGTTCHSHQIDQ